MKKNIIATVPFFCNSSGDDRDAPVVANVAMMIIGIAMMITGIMITMMRILLLLLLLLIFNQTLFSLSLSLSSPYTSPLLFPSFILLLCPPSLPSPSAYTFMPFSFIFESPFFFLLPLLPSLFNSTSESRVQNKCAKTDGTTTSMQCTCLALV